MSEAARLVEELASDFKPLHPTGYHGEDCNSIIFGDVEQTSETPRSRDLERVRSAYDQLKAMGIDAFPELIRVVDDDRHSFAGIYAAWHNHTVGDACQMIIGGHIEVWGYGYKSREAADGGHTGKPRYIWGLYASGDLQTWWAERQGRPLRELQIESLLWTIEQEETAGFKDDEQREWVLGPFQARLEELGYTSKPDQ